MAIFKNKAIHQELGFGTKQHTARVRFLNTNGSVYVRRSGLGLLGNLDVYHWLISAPALVLNFVILIWYIVINSIFAGIYFLVGPENFGGLEVPAGSTWEELGALFFLVPKPLPLLAMGMFIP